jgi:hypothetical protein
MAAHSEAAAQIAPNNPQEPALVQLLIQWYVPAADVRPLARATCPGLNQREFEADMSRQCLRISDLICIQPNRQWRLRSDQYLQNADDGLILFHQRVDSAARGAAMSTAQFEYK